jgi:hypothetical protein
VVQEAELPAGFAMQMRPKVEVFNFARSPEPEPETGAPPAADNEQVYTAMHRIFDMDFPTNVHPPEFLWSS